MPAIPQEISKDNASEPPRQAEVRQQWSCNCYMLQCVQAYVLAVEPGRAVGSESKAKESTGRAWRKAKVPDQRLLRVIRPGVTVESIVL